jgi:hypothetical protein
MYMSIRLLLLFHGICVYVPYTCMVSYLFDCGGIAAAFSPREQSDWTDDRERKAEHAMYCRWLHSSLIDNRADLGD